jgi:hypothetical protein
MACNKEEIKSGHLYIRYQTGDGGQREIDPCTNYWASPDLWLDPGNGSHQTTATEGQTVAIKARVTNMSGQGAIALEDVTVEAWVCDYTAGEVGPATAITPRFVGTTFGTISPGSSVEVTVDNWTPTHAQATTNGGHVCLGANTWAGDAGAPSDGRPIAPGGHLNYCCDSHCGQLNLQLTALSAGQKSKMKFSMSGGKGGFDGEIEMFPATGKVFGAAERKFVLNSQQLHEALSRSQLRHFNPVRSKLRPADFGLAGRGIEQGPHTKLKLKPKEKRWLEMDVEVSSRERPGSVQAFDVISRDRHGETVGGARLFAVVV